MPFLLTPTATQNVGPTPPTQLERIYYIAAEQVTWNYAPLGTSACKSGNRSATEANQGVGTYDDVGQTTGVVLGTQYMKAIFR